MFKITLLALFIGSATCFTAGVRRRPLTIQAHKGLFKDSARSTVPHNVLFASEDPELPFAVTRVSGSEENTDSSMGNDALDLAREKISKMSTETREPDLSEMPLQSAFLVFGTTALFLGLGRLPGIFFLIGGAVLMEKSFREELFEILLQKKPMSEASPELSTSVLLVLGICFAAILGELSIGFIRPLTVSNVVKE